MLNVKVGDCVGGGMEYVRADCADAAGSPQQVVKFVDVASAAEANDEAKAVQVCGKDAVDFLPYQAERKIACLGAVA